MLINPRFNTRLFSILAFLGTLMAYPNPNIEGQNNISSLTDQINALKVEDTLMVKLMNQLAYAYWNVDPEKTDSIGHEALKIAEKLNSIKWQANSKHKIAISYWMRGLYDDAFQVSAEALDLFEAIDYKPGYVNCYSMMALIMDDQQKYEKAIEYHRKALAIEITMDTVSQSLAKLYNNIAAIYLRHNILDSAEWYLTRSLKMREDLNDRYGIKECYVNLSIVYQNKEEYDESLSYLRMALTMVEELEDNNGRITTRHSLSQIYRKMGQIDSAYFFANSSLALAQKYKIRKRVAEAYNSLRHIALAEKNYQAAYEYAQSYHRIQDTIIGAESMQKVAELEAKFESQEKQKEIVALRQESKNRTLWRNIFAVSVLSSLIFIGLLVVSFRYRNQRKEALLKLESSEKEKLSELNQLKSRFFANISHEFRTPLTLISGPVKHLKEKIGDEDDQKMISLIDDNANKLNRLIDQILELSKMESGETKLSASHNNVVPLLRGLTSAFQSKALDRSIALNFYSEGPNFPIYFEQDKLEKAFTNLLSNAFKFTDDHGQIDVLIKKIKENDLFWLAVSVKDTGIGIPLEMQDQIFNRFYQAHTSQQGSTTGIGLSLTKEYVELHHGKVHVESIPKMGSTFTILIPFGRDHLSDNEVRAIPANLKTDFLVEPASETNQAPGITNSDGKEKPVMLVVEDSTDLRNYIGELFKNDYQMIFAEDGEVGVSRALEEIPDIVLSDVMMPKLSGIQLCESLKSKMATSHIPIILLTAKNDASDKVDGLSALADAYLSKPFDPREVKATAKTLVANRKILQDQNINQSLLKPSSIELPSLDQEFLRAINELMEENIGNEYFGVEQLAQDVHLSRSQLHRKMKAIVSITPSEYIKNFRLERAHQLLNDQVASVTEIAMMVGYGNPSYFTKIFQEKYNRLPSAILK